MICTVHKSPCFIMKVRRSYHRQAVTTSVKSGQFRVFRGSWPHIPAVPLFPPCFPDPVRLSPTRSRIPSFFSFRICCFTPLIPIPNCSDNSSLVIWLFSVISSSSLSLVFGVGKNRDSAPVFPSGCRPSFFLFLGEEIAEEILDLLPIHFNSWYMSIQTGRAGHNDAVIGYCVESQGCYKKPSSFMS